MHSTLKQDCAKVCIVWLLQARTTVYGFAFTDDEIARYLSTMHAEHAAEASVEGSIGARYGRGPVRTNMVWGPESVWITAVNPGLKFGGKCKSELTS